MIRKLSVVVLALLAGVLPFFVGQAQDVRGGSIEEIASSVVLIENIRGVRVVSTGTGTIVSPDGLIYTNQHVIEGGDDFAIYMLNEDLGEQPSLRYYASLRYVSETMDFAILQIDRDFNLNPVNPQAQALPYLTPAHENEMQVGDRIRIFGYPGIGDGYMIVTSGEIVAVQNGTINGERTPVWYRTDAEISGGNSGGLAVNEAGEFIGLPTWVVTEDRTAGRLGGILPIGALQRSLDANPMGSSMADGGGAAAPSGGGMLTVVNASQNVICSAFISPTTAPSWGDDLLGSREINIGASFTWDFPTGSYDILLKGCDGSTLEDFRNVEVITSTIFTYVPGGSTFVSGEETPGTTDPAPGTTPGVLTVVNNSSARICYVFISPTTASSWGDDQLGETEIISPGATRTWDLEPNVYDVLLQDCEQQTLRDTREVDVRSGSAQVVHN